MKIRFDNVVPHPFKGSSFHDESIWGKQQTYASTEHILLNATSGKGKTTFTNVLAGIRNDYDGTIFFDNDNIRSFSDENWAKWRKEKISFVFQDLQLFPQLTVAENLRLKNRLTDFKTEEILKNELSILGIDDKWSSKLGHLSMGQQQRVAIVRALCQPFVWIILDEPFSHLDHDNSLKAFELIQQNCKKQEAGFIITTLNDNTFIDYSLELKL